MSAPLTVNEFSVKKLKTLGIPDNLITYIADLPSLRTLNMDLMASVLIYCYSRGIFGNGQQIPGVSINTIKLKDDNDVRIAYNQYTVATKSYNIKIEAFYRDFLRYIWICYNHVVSRQYPGTILEIESIV